MAGGVYTMDPVTGLPAMQRPDGTLLPLPLTPDDMQLAGAQLAPPPGVQAAPPPTGPDLRVAGPGGGPMAAWGPADAPVDPTLFQQQDAAALRERLAPPATPPGASHGGPQSRFDQLGALGQPKPQAPGPSGVDPSTLARPGMQQAAGQGQPGGPRGDGTDDPLVQQAMAEAMRGGGGGGGPRGLGVTAQTRKYTMAGQVPEEVSARSAEAQGASDAYNEQLAISLNQRQEQAYQAQQAEFVGRAQAVQEQRAIQQEQQRRLQDFEAKWDAQSAEAAQMKVPQMEDYWGSRGDFANVMTGISIALGGALQGLRGGQNPGLEMSNQSIERWITAQREDYQRARTRADDMGNQYARMVRTFESENLAEQRLREQAYTVRDNMMQAYAQKLGTPSALEAYNQAQLQSEAQRAAMQEKAYADAGAEIEEKLTLQGGGGGGKPKGVLDMLRAGAEAKKLKDVIAGDNRANPGRAIDTGKTDALAAALDTVDAADAVTSTVNALGYADDDTDDPRSGPVDFVTKNIPGTQTRRHGQDLDQDTFRLARGAQTFLGKSDNDAALADKQVTGGGSGRERIQAARRLREKAINKAKVEISGMTPDQRDAFFAALPADQRSKFETMLSVDSRPAASEQVVR